MPTRPEVKNLIRLVKDIDQRVNQADRNANIATANFRESSMNGTAINAANQLFENSIRPHYLARFNRYGADRQSCIEGIFREIKRLLLNRIINDSDPRDLSEPAKSWLRNNIEILVNNNPRTHSAIFQTSREYLNKNVCDQVAWRNFDPGAPFINEFSENIFDFANSSTDADRARERIAYYYLVVTDDRCLGIDQEKRIFMTGNFIAWLRDIRRGHNDDQIVEYSRDRGRLITRSRQNENDLPSCVSGMWGRLAKCGQGHPIADATTDGARMLAAIKTMVSSSLYDRFISLSASEKERYLKSLENLQKIYHQDILDDNDEYDPENERLYEALLEILDTVGVDTHNGFEVKEAALRLLIQNAYGTDAYNNMAYSGLNLIRLKIQNIMLSLSDNLAEIVSSIFGPEPVDLAPATIPVEPVAVVVPPPAVVVPPVAVAPVALVPQANINATLALNLTRRLEGRAAIGARSRYTLNVNNTPYNGPYSDTIDFPQNMPVIHPYDPIDGVNPVYDGGIPYFPIVATINSGNINLPAGIRQLLAQHNIGINNLTVNFCAQSAPWLNNQPLLLRPHAWLHQNAPFNGNYNQGSNIVVGVASIDGRFSPLINEHVSTHGEGGNVVYSPNNMGIAGVDDLTQSHRLYSFCFNPATGQATVTLHWLLNEDDYQVLNMGLVNNNQVPLNEIANLEQNFLVFQDGLQASSVRSLITGEQLNNNRNHLGYRLAAQQPLPPQQEQAPEDDEVQRAIDLSLSEQTVEPDADATSPQILPPAPVIEVHEEVDVDDEVLQTAIQLSIIEAEQRAAQELERLSRIAAREEAEERVRQARLTAERERQARIATREAEELARQAARLTAERERLERERQERERAQQQPAAQTEEQRIAALRATVRASRRNC